MKRKNVLFFPCSFFFFFLSNTKLIPAPRHGFSETVACSVSAKLGRFRALHLAIFAREGKKEREKRGEKRKKKMRDAIHSKRNFFESEYRCSEVNYAHFHRFLRFARGGRSNGGTGVVADITVVGRFDFSRIKGIKDFARSKKFRRRFD